ASKSAAIIATRGRHKNTASLPAEPMPYARLRAPTPSVERRPFQMMSTVDRLAGDSSATCVPFDATRMLREGRAILFIDLNAEIAHRALDLLVAQQKLYCSQVAGPAGGFSSAPRVRPEDAPV